MLKWLRRLVVTILGLAVLGLIAFWTFAPGIVGKGRNAVLPHDPYPVSPQAQALHERIIVGDWHADPLLWNRDLAKRSSWGQVDFPRLAQGNVALQVFTAVTKSPAGQNYENNSADTFDNITLLAFGLLWPIRTWGSLTERALYQAEKLHKFAAAYDGPVTIIKSGEDLADVLAARASGEKRLGAILGIEGAHALEGDIANLDVLVDAGYRLIGLHHFFDNELGGSLHGQGNHGLTDFGRQVVAEVAKRPLILDLAHSSPQVARDVMAMTEIPLVVSHTGLHSHCPVKRNFEDPLMIAIAQGGGVIGLGYWDEVTCQQMDPAGIAAMARAAIAVLGEDAVSLGSDFDGSVATAFDTSELAALTHAMLQAGLTETQITKVMGGNMVRVLRARLGG
jgi:microsomal dipeptidase-like Zn-dependent dipeptidase